MTNLLFIDYNLDLVLKRQDKELSDDVESLSEDRVLNTSPEGLCNYFVEKYIVEPLQIDETGINADYGDAQIDISQRFDYAVFDRSRPYSITGTRLTFYIPFTGDRNLFKCRPSTYTGNPPRATVESSELVLTYEQTTQNTPAIEKEFELDRQRIKNYLGWITSDVEQFNSTLRGRASQCITARREKLLEDRGLVERLGFPLRRREDVPVTYASPKVKRRIAPQLPPISREPYRPEPALDMDDYEYILSVLSNMVTVMELSPKAFKGMGEEDLRTHFLVHLNGHYKGQATGETFNYEGKTDILVRSEDRNIFIAECKFWTGPSGLREALDQLLGYTSWRDTKTALLVFNRDREMSTVLNGIPKVVREHSSYKADSVYNSETGFRYVFGHRDAVVELLSMPRWHVMSDLLKKWRLSQSRSRTATSWNDGTLDSYKLFVSAGMQRPMPLRRQ